MSTAETILLLKLAKSIKDIKSRAPEKGDRGREPTADEIKQAVELYMAFNAESFRGAPGKAAKANNGEDGVGIDDIEWVGNTVIFHLTDGREIEHKLPRTRDVFMGGGTSEDRVKELVQQLGGIQQIFIGLPKDIPTYPALAFVDLASYPGLYLEQVNIP